ncbi:MAG: DUF4166 domain-containing protein [Solibacillus sp.]
MIYERLLGTQFKKLHPKLQHRYTLPLNEPFYAEGVMHKIEQGIVLFKPFFHLTTHLEFLFPEAGENIPFTLKNTYIINEQGEHLITFERKFYFEHITRSFYSAMHIDLEHNRALDTFGKPALVSTTLGFKVTQDGSLITKSGAQNMIVPYAKIPLPSMLSTRGQSVDGYDEERDAFTIEVTNYNPVVGRIVNYLGEYWE